MSHRALHPCVDGHSWRYIGGSNCGCHPDAQCSLPVRQCEICGDCDYGQNAEAEATKVACPEVEECKVKGSPYDGLPPFHLTKAEFDALDEYSATLPTGTTPGKRWKRHDGAFDPSCEKPFWLIGEFGDVTPDGKSIRINWYVPVLKLDAPLAGGAA